MPIHSREGRKRELRPSPALPVLLSMLFSMPLSGILGSAGAQIAVPEGFVVETWHDERWRIEAVTNLAYGSGLLCGRVIDQVLVVGALEGPGEMDTMLTVPGVTLRELRMDRSGVFGNQLLVFLQVESGTGTVSVYEVSPSGDAELKVEVNDPNGPFAPVVELLGGSEYSTSAMLMDGSCCPQPIFGLNGQYDVTLELEHWAPPPGRTDLDQTRMRLDPTGLYDDYLTITDADTNNDGVTAIYQLSPELQWSTLVPPIPLTQRYFVSLAFSTAGELGSVLYVADYLNGEVLRVLPNGALEPFASGFDQPLHLAVDPSGQRMWVTDENGVHAISAEPPAGVADGPAVRMLLSAPHPNPAQSTVGSRLFLTEGQQVRAAVYDVRGALVTTLFDRFLQAGEHDVVWRRPPSRPGGVYLLAVRVGAEQVERKLIMVE